MKTTYLTFYERTILESIDLEPYNIFTENEFEQIQEVYKIFLLEYVHKNNKHERETKLFADWLRGLPSSLSIPFSNYEILQNALVEGFNVSTEEAEDYFLEMYWGNLSNAFFTLKDNL